MAVVIYDMTIGQTAGVEVVTTGKSRPTNDGLLGFAQMVVSASGQGLTGDTAGDGNIVAITGASVADGSITFSANSQSVVIDTQGFENVALTVSGFGTATLAIQWSNLTGSGFTAGQVVNINSAATATTITANGQYTAASGGRYLRLITTAYTSGPIVVTPTLYAGGGSGAASSGSSTVAKATATAAAPSYTEGTDANLSQDLSGNLRTADSALLAAVQTPAETLPPIGILAPTDNQYSAPTYTVVNISSATTTELISATASQYGRIVAIVLVVGGANVLTFKSATTAISGPLTFGSGGGAFVLDPIGYPWLKTAVNEALNLTTTTTAAVAGWVLTKKSA